MISYYFQNLPIDEFSFHSIHAIFLMPFDVTRVDGHIRRIFHYELHKIYNLFHIGPARLYIDVVRRNSFH